MRVIETSYGKDIIWGHNCTENVRDLRKLQACCMTRHPDYESFAKRSDELNERIMSLCEKLDKLIMLNDGVWLEPVVKEYNRLIKELEDANHALYDLCVFEYPRDANKLGYSYCI